MQETETDQDEKDEEIERISKEQQREEKQMVMTERYWGGWRALH